MDQPRRLGQVEVCRILEASGVRHLDQDSSHGEILRAIILTKRLVMNAYLNDIALVYAALVGDFEVRRINLPWVTEDVFFGDRINLELHSVEHNVEGIREEVREVVVRDRDPGEEEHRGEPRGEHGGHTRRVEIVVPGRGKRIREGSGEAGGASEVQGGPEPVEVTRRSGPRDDLPF